MRRTSKFLLALCALVLLPFVAGCTDAQLASFQHGLGNFNAGVAAVDASVKATSATLYSNCTNLQAVGQAAVDIAGQCTKASPVLNAVNDVITGYCTAAPASGIAAAVATTAQTVNATKTQLSAAKRACGGA